ncbi:bacterial transcriptional activator domain-containing protein, partial [bacterium]|nr:bacterial transcriptional activator domain-containing protein [bacterium]
GASPAFDTANANLSNNQSTVLDTDKTLAQNLADTGKLDQAIKERENVLSSNPKDTPTAQFLLAAYAVMNNNSGAISVAGQLINIDPANTQAYSMELAAAHERAGERDAAIAAYTQATQGPDPAIASQAKEKIEALNSKK